MNTKVCSRCHTEKPISAFYPRKDRPGLYVAWCKPCLVEHGREYRQTEQGKKTTEAYNQSENRKQSLAKYNVSDKRTAVSLRYYLTGKPKEHLARRKKTDRNYSKKKATQATARRAILSGKITPQPCEFSHLNNCHGRIEMHHDDYSRPLVIRWLCSRHHHLITVGSLT